MTVTIKIMTTTITTTIVILRPTLCPLQTDLLTAVEVAKGTGEKLKDAKV